MKKLRREVLDRIANVIANQVACSNCKRAIEKWMPFCMSCGGENIKFSILSLNAEGYTTLERLRERLCYASHQLVGVIENEDMEFTVDHIDGIRSTTPFCPYCGVQIMRISVH